MNEFVCTVPLKAKVMKMGPHFKVPSNIVEKPEIEPANPGLQGKQLIHYTTVAPIHNEYIYEINLIFGKFKES